jgi:hypothetical protein
VGDRLVGRLEETKRVAVSGVDHEGGSSFGVDEAKVEYPTPRARSALRPLPARPGSPSAPLGTQSRSRSGEALTPRLGLR